MPPAAKSFENATSFATLGSDLRDRAMSYSRYWGMYDVNTTQTLPNGIVARPVTFEGFKANFK